MNRKILRGDAVIACVIIMIVSLAIGLGFGYVIWHNDYPPIKTIFEDGKEGGKFYYEGRVSFLFNNNSMTIKFDDANENTKIEPIK